MFFTQALEVGFGGRIRRCFFFVSLPLRFRIWQKLAVKTFLTLPALWLVAFSMDFSLWKSGAECCCSPYRAPSQPVYADGPLMIGKYVLFATYPRRHRKILPLKPTHPPQKKAFFQTTKSFWFRYVMPGGISAYFKLPHLRMWMMMALAPLAMKSFWRWWLTRSWTAIPKMPLGPVWKQRYPPWNYCNTHTLKIGLPKRIFFIFQPFIFRDYFSFRKGICKVIPIY